MCHLCYLVDFHVYKEENEKVGIFKTNNMILKRKSSVYAITISIFLSCLFLPIFKAEARSGCCSWHGGVSYCDTSVGTYICNDGTYSPSCGCTYIQPKPICAKPTIKTVAS